MAATSAASIAGTLVIITAGFHQVGSPAGQ
jgi:hypothetical protein